MLSGDMLKQVHVGGSDKFVMGYSINELRPNGLRISRRERAVQEGIKKATILREAVNCNAVLGRAS